MRRAPRGLATWTLEQRFWRSVDTSGDCWMWTGAKSFSGYGHLTSNNRRVLAHRVSYEINVSPIPDGMVICHSCDVPSCVNPAHLFVGTVADNNRDMWSKGRGRGLDPHNGKLTDDQRREAVARVTAGETKTAVAKSLGVTRQAINHLVKAGIYA